MSLELRAGALGAYLPDYFGPFLETCHHGFYAGILTLSGKSAGTAQIGCATSGPEPVIAYVKLDPGEVRTWSTDLETRFIDSGHYCLYAEYLSPERDIAAGQGLPDDKALVAAGRITSKPIPITIR